jgi:hypothetical protein
VWYEKSFGARNARYVRLRAQRVLAFGAYCVQMAEMEVWGVGPTKVGANGVVTSGNYSISYTGIQAVDGDVGTFWSSATSGVAGEETLTMDLGVTRSVGKVRMMPRSTYYQAFPSVFVVEVSTDGVSYVTAVSESGYVAGNGVWYEKSFGARNARYVRLRAQRVLAFGAYCVQMAEMEVYESAQQAVQLSWTAPGDNGASGTASSYEVKYSTVGAITDETKWTAATAITSGVPTPSVAGTAQSMNVTLTGLAGVSSGKTVYFCVRAKDEANNLGGVSNPVSVNVP